VIARTGKNSHWGQFLLIAFLVLLPTIAYPHAFGRRYDLPLPLSFYLSAAAIAVAASFVVTFFFMRPNPARRLQSRLLLKPRLTILLCNLLRLLGLFVLILILTTALIGDASPTKNLATVTVWVLWWVGMTLFTALIINLWPLLNPFYTIAQWVCRFMPTQPQPLPTIASYVAVSGFLFLSWIELVSDISETPVQLFWLIIIYLFFSCLCARRYGIDTWFKHADPLTRMFDFFGRVAPLGFTPATGLVIRLPGSGLIQSAETQSKKPSVIFIIALISVVLFDGLSETPIWQEILNFITQSPAWRPLLLDMKSMGIDILALLKTSGLLIVFLAAIVTYCVLCFFIWLAVSRRVPLGIIAWRFAPSLLPIAIAYHLAHYISYLLLAGQLILPILSDPFAMGWDLFGTRVLRIDLSVINAEDVWWIAMAAIIIGHIIAVFVSHHEAQLLFPQRTLAIRSQIPMMIFMALLTFCSLWILAQPIIN